MGGGGVNDAAARPHQVLGRRAARPAAPIVICPTDMDLNEARRRRLQGTRRGGGWPALWTGAPASPCCCPNGKGWKGLRIVLLGIAIVRVGKFSRPLTWTTAGWRAAGGLHKPPRTRRKERMSGLHRSNAPPAAAPHPNGHDRRRRHGAAAPPASCPGITPFAVIAARSLLNVASSPQGSARCKGRHSRMGNQQLVPVFPSCPSCL